MEIGFTKMHGIGNDFVVADNFNGRIKLTKEEIAYLCDRHIGIGADGLILLEKSDAYDCFMNYYNSDGTPAEMCGNGVRCVAKFLKDGYLPKNESFRIDTRAGVKEVRYLGEDVFSVNMGKPSFAGEKEEKSGLTFHFASMGNPHAVALVDELAKHDISVIGPMFLDKVNVELVERKSEDRFRMKVWERGCGITLACGTGACAAYAVLTREGKAKGEIWMELPGGLLRISENEKGEIIMKGEAKSVFSGVVGML